MRPDAVVDLQTDEGAALVAGQWRYSDCRIEEIDFVELGSPEDPLGPGTVPNRTYDVVPHAEGVDFDDSDWRVLSPEETMLRLANGRVCFNWYRIAVTLPERIGDHDVAGSTVVFEVVVDDYAEVWVNGELPFALGDRGGPVVAGFNAPNRVVLTRDARPGERYQIAVFGINGPISASPRNYIWIRNASLDFYRARDREAVELVANGFEDARSPLVAPDGAVLFSAGNTIYRASDGVVTVFRPKSSGTLKYSPDGLLVIAEHERSRTIRVNPHGDVTVLGEASPEPPAFEARLPVELPEPATGVSRNGNTLYATTATSLYRIDLKEE